MKIFHGTDNAGISRGTVLTLGVFDGLHLGHQRIMQTGRGTCEGDRQRSDRDNFRSASASRVISRKLAALLQTLDQRLANFEVLGIKQTIVIRFDKEFADLNAEDFLRDIVHERLQAKEVYLGKGFFFGKNRGGNIELLKKMSAELGFVADEVPEIRLRGTRISSSKIRELLADGKVNLARRMLGRPYGVEGQIIHGDRRGRTIGFPTANLHPHNRVIPRYGVYATANLIEGVWRRSITNVGIRPTFAGDTEPSIESYIFDFDGDLYGDVLRVRFLHRIRDERKFSGIDELKNQIQRDTRTALNYFKRLGVKNSLDIV